MAGHVTSSKTYVVICGILLALTLVTWAVARVDLGRWNLVAALGIAFGKATLVALFFMHVKDSSRRVALTVIAGVFWLGILMLLTMSDYVTR